MEEYFTECQQKAKWKAESYQHRVVVGTRNLSFQSHSYVIWQRLEPTIEDMSRKVGASSGG